MGYNGMLNQQKWPKYDAAKCVEASIEIPVQVNGKLRATVKVAADADAQTVLAAAKADETVKSFTEGKNIFKEIYVPGKIVNIVVK